MNDHEFLGRTHPAAAALIALTWGCGCACAGTNPRVSASDGGDPATAAPASDSGLDPDPPPGACTPLEDVPLLPPLGERRCIGLPAGATWDPAAVGPFPVGVVTLDLADPLRPGRTLTTEVWYPADESARGQPGEAYALSLSDVATMMGVSVPFSFGEIDVFETSAVRDAPRAPADPDAGLVVFSHGFRGMRYQSTFLTVWLASHGYVVAAPDHAGNTLFDDSATPEQSAVDRVEDMAFVTSEMTARARSATDFFAAAFDPRRVAWTGHSFGASTVLMAGALDEREMLAMPLAPAFDDRMALVYNPPSYDLRAALVAFGGTADDTTPLADAELAYDRSVAPRHLVALDGSNHFDFTDVCANPTLRLVPQIGDGCGADPDAAQRTIRTLATAALHRFVRCDPGAAAWLDPASVLAREDVADYRVDAPTSAAPPAPDEPPTAICDLPPDPTAPPLEPRTITRAGAPPIHARMGGVGGGPPLVFLHGFGTSSAVFDRALAALGTRTTVVAIDLRGHGASGVDPDAPFGPDGAAATADDPYRLDAHVADVLAALEALALDEAVLVGWSSGGQIALEVARTAPPGRVRALVLVDAAPLTVPDPTLHPDYAGGGTLEFARNLRLALAAEPAPDALWRPVVENYFRPGAPDALVDEYLDGLTAIPWQTRVGQILAGRPDLVDALAGIAVPVLIVHGEQDHALRLESARYLAGALPDARLEIFQRSGHAPFAEEPERFNRALADFLDAL